jgi:hypothetical protein
MFPLHHQIMKIQGLRMLLSYILLHLPLVSHRQKLELNQQAVERPTLLLMPLLSMSLMVLKGGVNSACKLLIYLSNFNRIKKK